MLVVIGLGVAAEDGMEERWTYRVRHGNDGYWFETNGSNHRYPEKVSLFLNAFTREAPYVQHRWRRSLSRLLLLDKMSMYSDAAPWHGVVSRGR